MAGSAIDAIVIVMSLDYRSEAQRLPFIDYHQGCMDYPVGINSPISDFINPLADGQYMEFDAGDAPAGSDPCDAIRTGGITQRAVSNWSPVSRTEAADNALLCLYVSTMGYQEIISPTVIKDKQVTAELFHGPSVGVAYGDGQVYHTPKSIGREEIMDSNANTSGHGSNMEVVAGRSHTASGKIKKQRSHPDVSGSVCHTNLQKLNRARCKSRQSSRASKNHDENSNKKLDVIRPETPELLSNIVKKKRKAAMNYIQVTARRGHATDSHSLAERVRRQKISDRMNMLQNLVPGCSKITKKALVLEEIINYVQSLQNQVEILSMKIASVIPLRASDFQISGHPSKEF